MLATRLSRSVGDLSKLRYVLGLRNLYLNTIDPHLLYGKAAWGNIFDNNLKILTVLQNKVIKILSWRKWQDFAAQYYKQLRILKMKDHMFTKSLI